MRSSTKERRRTRKKLARPTSPGQHMSPNASQSSELEAVHETPRKRGKLSWVAALKQEHGNHPHLAWHLYHQSAQASIAMAGRRAAAKSPAGSEDTMSTWHLDNGILQDSRQLATEHRTENHDVKRKRNRCASFENSSCAPHHTNTHLLWKDTSCCLTQMLQRLTTSSTMF